MIFNIGDIIYNGGGNGTFCTFTKCRIRQIMAQRYYIVEILEDYGSIWDKPADKTAEIGSLANCIEVNSFKTYKEAKTKIYKDMGFKLNRDYIKAYFNNN